MALDPTYTFLEVHVLSARFGGFFCLTFHFEYSSLSPRHVAYFLFNINITFENLRNIHAFVPASEYIIH